MNVKKANGVIFGAALTSAEKKAMDIEITRQLGEHSRMHEQNIDALVLWQLHKQLGFGKKRLRRFYDNFNIAMVELIVKYEDPNDTDVYLATKALKECGIDLEAWDNEEN